MFIYNFNSINDRRYLNSNIILHIIIRNSLNGMAYIYMKNSLTVKEKEHCNLCIFL